MSWIESETLKGIVVLSSISVLLVQILVRQLKIEFLVLNLKNRFLSWCHDEISTRYYWKVMEKNDFALCFLGQFNAFLALYHHEKMEL